jgi:peroxiredoxin/predicted 2-oxoglutarate/Fe(II)-dependent dioxygenase YbiX
MSRKPFKIGDPVPWFSCRTPIKDRFHFESMGGTRVVLTFFGALTEPSSVRVLNDLLSRRDVFDDDNACFFGVSIDPKDESLSEIQKPMVGIRFFWDFDQNVSRLYGAAPSADGCNAYQRFSLVLDERLRVVSYIPFEGNLEQHAQQIMDSLKSLEPLVPEGPAAPWAPVLLVPRVFESELCRRLIEYYEAHPSHDSGVMREINGKTTLVSAHEFKRRRDCDVTDDQLRLETMHRIHDRLAPEVYKTFQFRATRIERYMVACYDGATMDHFCRHRDNSTRGTAHRRFAVSLNLNAGFDGGTLRFPEFGNQYYRPPVGGAIVFSCSLLHEAMPITNGKRYAFLPFLYDEAAAAIRQENLKYLSEKFRRE